jgi:glutathione S-transferase kappa 1
MQATGNKPPASLPAKGVYLVEDLHRNATFYFELPQKTVLPSVFPVNSLLAMRVLTAIKIQVRDRTKRHAPLLILQTQHPEKLIPTTRMIWQKYFHEDLDISQEAVIKEALKAVGFSNESCDLLLATAQTKEIKDELKRATDTAIQNGNQSLLST